MSIYSFLSIWLVFWAIGAFVAKIKFNAQQWIMVGFFVGMLFSGCVLGLSLLLDVDAKKNHTTIQPVSEEPKTIYNNENVAYDYAKSQYQMMIADYELNDELYQNSDADGLQALRSEMSERALTEVQHDGNAPIKYYFACEQAYHQLMPLNFLYLDEAINQDNKNLDSINSQLEQYRYWLKQCDEALSINITLD